MTDPHLILRRYRDSRSTGTAHGAECSCGEKITAASPRTRDDLVATHLGQPVWSWHTEGTTP